MKVMGPAVDALVKAAPETHSKYVVCEGKTKALHSWVLKAICGSLQSAMLCHKKFKQDIESIGFEANHCDPCVANKMIDGKQMTMCWHADDKLSDTTGTWLK